MCVVSSAANPQARPPTFLSIYLATRISICLSGLSAFLFSCLSAYLPICLSFYLPMCARARAHAPRACLFASVRGCVHLRSPARACVGAVLWVCTHVRDLGAEKLLLINSSGIRLLATAQLFFRNCRVLTRSGLHEQSRSARMLRRGHEQEGVGRVPWVFLHAIIHRELTTHVVQDLQSTQNQNSDP